MRVWVLALALAAVSGCLVDVDYGGTSFSCSLNQVCPDGFVCHDGACLVPDEIPDGQVSALRRHTLEVTGQVTGTLSDAPVLVALDPGRIDYDLAAADGSDLRFEDAGGAPLAHEIERWVPGGTSAVWVRLPSLETGATFSMLYGDGELASQQISDVWTAYDLIYHLAASGDESRLGFNASAQNGVTHGDGRIGGAAVFDGVDDYYEIGQDIPLMRGATAGSASAWVRPATAGGSILEIAINGGGTSRMFATMVATGEFRLGIRTQDLTGASQNATSLVAPDLGQWVWVAGVADFTTETIVIYINGVESGRAEMLLMDPSTPDTNAAIATIGIDDGLAAGQFLGSIDEVRCTPVALTPAWIAAQYLSMTDGLLTYGPATPAD